MSRDEIDERTPLLDDEQKKKATPLPMGQFLLICFLRVTEPVAFVVCFPFVNQMLLDLGVVEDPKKVGFYAGLIESIFSVAQLLTVFHWGQLSDRFGRKPILLIGCLGSAISGISFGFSTSFAMMVATRSIAGLMNGNVVVIKSMLAEITDETNASKAFAVFPLLYSIGTIIASVLGGSLVSFPAEHETFRRLFPIFTTYPYLLPCLLAGIFPLISGGMAVLFLKETLERPDPDKVSTEPEEQLHTARELLTTAVKKMLLNFGILALQSTALMGLIPLYCFTPIKDGGLGFGEGNIGKALSIRAVATIVVQIVGFPYLQRRVGTMRLYRLLMALFIPTFLMMPLINVVARLGQPAWVWVGLVVTLLTGSTANMAFSCNMLLVNEAAPNRRSLGAINGMAQVVASAMRAVGPGAATTLFALSVDQHILGGNLIWVCLTLCAVCGAMASMSM